MIATVSVRLSDQSHRHVSVTVSPIGSVYGSSGGDSTGTSWVVLSEKSSSIVVRLAEAIEFSEFLTVILKNSMLAVVKVAPVIDNCAAFGVVWVRWNA